MNKGTRKVSEMFSSRQFKLMTCSWAACPAAIEVNCLCVAALRSVLSLVMCVPSHVQVFVAPWTIARQAPLPMEFSRQEYRSGVPCPPPEDLPSPETEPMSLASPALVGFPCGSDSKESACNAGDLASIPGLGIAALSFTSLTIPPVFKMSCLSPSL